MNRDNMIGVLEFLEEQNEKKLGKFPMNNVECFTDEYNIYNVVNFVTGNIRGYIDLEHAKSVRIDRNVSLLRTKQQGYVPLEYFPREVKDFSDEMKVKKICSKIIKLEKNAMKDLMNYGLVTNNDIGRVFTTGDIIIGDSEHASSGIYVPFVDENSIVVREDIIDPKVKKLIKKYYIDKM